MAFAAVACLMLAVFFRAMEVKPQENIVEADGDQVSDSSTMRNLLLVLQSEEADLLDKVLLEMLVEDIHRLLQEGW